jgi:hypothetical protein
MKRDLASRKRGQVAERFLAPLEMTALAVIRGEVKAASPPLPPQPH